MVCPQRQQPLPSLSPWAWGRRGAGRLCGRGLPRLSLGLRLQVQGEDLSSPSCMLGGREVLGGGLLSDPCPPVASSDDMTLTSPSMDNSSAELLPSGDSPLNKRMTENLLASLSEHERAAILSVPAAQNPEDLRMFARWERVTRGARPKSRVRTGSGWGCTQQPAT